MGVTEGLGYGLGAINLANCGPQNPANPILQYSTTPLLHYSVTPLLPGCYHPFSTSSVACGTFPGMDVRPADLVRYRQTSDRRRSEFRRNNTKDRSAFLD